MDVNRLPEYRPQHNQRSQQVGPEKVMLYGDSSIKCADFLKVLFKHIFLQHEEKRVEETEEEDDDEEMQNVEEEIHIPSAAEQQPAAPEGKQNSVIYIEMYI